MRISRTACARASFPKKRVLNEAVRKVLEYKEKFVAPRVPAEKAVKKILREQKKEPFEAMRQSAEKSITLLRNRAGLLPLRNVPKHARIAIIRPTMGRLMMSDNTNFYPFDFKDVFSQYFDNVQEYVRRPPAKRHRGARRE